MARVALVTTDPAYVGDEDDDRPILLDALRSLGIDATDPEWADPGVKWSDFDLVVMRSPWDYPDRLDEFLAWLARAESATRVLNGPDLIRWNLDKRYLHELQEAGVPVVPSAFATDERAADALIEAAARENRELIVKPNVSAGSRDTGRFASGDPEANALARRILGLGKVVVVQPFVASVAADGEVAAVYFDGRFSHAFTKGPILASGGGFLGGGYAEVVRAMELTAAQAAVGQQAIAAVESLTRDHGFGGASPTPLYARIDMVRADDGSPLLLEAELFEPSFFVATAPGSEARFAAAVEARL